MYAKYNPSYDPPLISIGLIETLRENSQRLSYLAFSPFFTVAIAIGFLRHLLVVALVDCTVNLFLLIIHFPLADICAVIDKMIGQFAFRFA